MKTKFTPGSWKANPTNSLIQSEKCQVSTRTGDKWIETYQSGKSDIEDEANAALIAAAPEMYALLNQILELDRSEVSALGKDISLLLAKARGEI